MEKKGVDSAKGEMKCMGGKKDYRGEKKGTIAKKKKRLRVEMKGAVSTQGENKLHEGGKKMRKEKMKDNGEGEKAEELRTEIKGAHSAKGK